MLESDVLTPSRAEAASRKIPPEWHPQLRGLAPRWLVPSSCQLQQEAWSWLREAYFPISYESFAAEMKDLLPETKVLRLDPGETFDLTTEAKRAPLTWVKGERGGDYVYDPKPQTTAEIACHFAPAKDLTDFLEKELPAKLAVTDLEDEAYFRKNREWRLRVFHHDGRCEEHDYLLAGKDSRKIPRAANIAWETEIPARKLELALTEGESLSSLYLRINDRKFTNDDEVAAADTLADPLLRVLYGEDLFGYQRAQLRRLQSRDSKGKRD